MHADFLQKNELQQITTPKGRYYQHKDGSKFISVTTVLSKNTNKDSLNKWRARVGEKEASRITNNALRKGTAMHNYCEQYLMHKVNGQPITDMPNPEVYESFYSIKPYIDENLKAIYGIEHMLYSRILSTAGTADVIGKWGDVNAIIDFKTASRPKTKDMIENYFIQATVYSIMCYELYKLEIPKIVIIMAVNQNTPLIFEERIKTYLPRVKSLFSNTKTLIDEIVN